MSVDMRVQGCPKCNEHPQDCECHGSECGRCGSLTEEDFHKDWNICGECYERTSEHCLHCEKEICTEDYPGPAIITYVASSARPEETEEWFFCDNNCVREWRDSK